MPDTLPRRWEPERSPRRTPRPTPPLRVALGRGAAGRCPCCGRTRLFAGYLAVTSVCASCGAPLGRVPADDTPPYVTIVLVALVVTPLVLATELHSHPPLRIHALIWIPLALVLAVALLRPVKGATIGLLLCLGMVRAEDDAAGRLGPGDV